MNFREQDKGTKYLFTYVMIIFPTIVIGIILYYQFEVYFSITHQTNISMSLCIGLLISIVVVISIKEKIEVQNK